MASSRKTPTLCERDTTTLFHASVHFVPVLVKGLYQTESYSLHVMQLIRILSTEEYLYFPHLVVWGRYCACELLIANPIDWLFAVCLEYFISFSIDSSKARKWNSVVIKDRERDVRVQVLQNVKVNFKWGWNKSSFDINSVLFHFDDSKYGRRSQPYCF
jgi:hypothetical protein